MGLCENAVPLLAQRLLDNKSQDQEQKETLSPTESISLSLFKGELKPELGYFDAPRLVFAQFPSTMEYSLVCCALGEGKDVEPWKQCGRGCIFEGVVENLLMEWFCVHAVVM